MTKRIETELNTVELRDRFYIYDSREGCINKEHNEKILTQIKQDAKIVSSLLLVYQGVIVAENQYLELMKKDPKIAWELRLAEIGGVKNLLLAIFGGEDSIQQLIGDKK